MVQNASGQQVVTKGADRMESFSARAGRWPHCGAASGAFAGIIVFLGGLAVILLDLSDGALSVLDVDDRMRALQIRFLLSDEGSWFGMRLPFVQTPEVYVSPWSRLVDLPYVAITRLLGLGLPQETALAVSFVLWPLAMLGIFSLLVAQIVGPFLSPRWTPLVRVCVLGMMTLAMAPAVLEFTPGRIDHHNMQILAMLSIAFGLVRFDRAGGVVIGLACAASLLIGLECLPFVALTAVGLGLSYVARARQSLAVMQAAAWSLAVGAIGGGLIFSGPAALASVQCDAFSAPYLLLALGGAATLLVARWGVGEQRSPVARAVVLIASAGLVMGLAALLFPECLSGPYQIIDPLTRALWLDRIPQENGLVYFYDAGRYAYIVPVFLLALAAAVTLVPVLVTASRRPGLAILYGLGLASLLLTIMLARYIRFPAAMVPLLLPFAAQILLAADAAKHIRRAVAGMCLAAACTFAALSAVYPAREIALDTLDEMAFSTCEGEDFSILAQLPPGRVLAPLGLSMPLLSAMPRGFSVAAIPFHRAAPGMLLSFRAFTTSDAKARRAALAPFDYVAVCKQGGKVDRRQAPLYAALVEGEGWPGLSPIASPIPTAFQIFRINHANLR